MARSPTSRWRTTCAIRGPAPRAEIIHRFGRADQVDRESLRRLVRSIGRFLDPADAVAATVSGEVRVLDSRPMGACWVADQLWQRFGIGEAIRSAVGGGRVDAEAVERTTFAMVANRLSVKPLSKLAGCGWVAQRAFVDGLTEVSEDACQGLSKKRPVTARPTTVNDQVRRNALPHL